MADDSIQKPIKITMPRISQAFNKAKALDEEHEAAVVTSKNRIALMLDDSGSMDERVDNNKTRIQYLHDAVAGFIDATNFEDTAVALVGLAARTYSPLSNNQNSLRLLGTTIPTVANTPIGETLDYVLENIAATRGVLISDGESTDMVHDSTLAAFKELGVPVDCVHISKDNRGVDLLQRIAERTGGIFVKFEDVGTFAKALKYLSPALRGLLTSGTAEDARELLGADRVKL